MDFSQLPSPASPESEAIVIATCLLSEDGSVYDELSQLIDATDFFVQRNGIIFDHIGKIVSAGLECNAVTLVESLRSSGDEDGAGGISAIFEIQDQATTTKSAQWAAETVLERSRRRKLIRHNRVALEDLHGGEKDSIEIGAKLETEIQELSDLKGSKDNSISHATDSLREDFKAMLAGTYEIEALSTGIPHLDEKLDFGGIGNGEVLVLSAPTSCGKTQLALNIVLRASVTDNIAGLYFSFEMPAKQLSKRMTQTASAVNLKKFRNGEVSDKEQKRVWDAMAKIESSPIYTEHYVKSVEELRAKARMAKRRSGIEWIVVDYLQLVPFDKRMKKNDGIAEISHQIKQMAIELDIKVILLAQVNREGARRESGLSLYDLKDSGDIENDADIILLMWPDGVDVDDARRLDADMNPYISLKYNIAKNREGERDVKGEFKFRNNIGRFH